MFINTIIFIILVLLAQIVWSTSVVTSLKGTCPVEYDGEKLQEGDIINIKGKLHKVEDCELHRAYHACGTHILIMINIVCQAVEQEKKISINKRLPRFVKQKLLTEACCQSLCTISEMTRYCP